jgi:hypothetical protein
MTVRIWFSFALKTIAGNQFFKYQAFIGVVDFLEFVANDGEEAFFTEADGAEPDVFFLEIFDNFNAGGAVAEDDTIFPD